MEHSYYNMLTALIFSLGTKSEEEYKYKLSEFFDISSDEINNLIEERQLYYSTAYVDFYKDLLEQSKDKIRDYTISITVLYDYILYEKSDLYKTEQVNNTLRIFADNDPETFIEITDFKNAMNAVSNATSMYVSNIVKPLIYDNKKFYDAVVIVKYIEIVSTFSFFNKKLSNQLQKAFIGIPTNINLLLKNHKTFNFKLIFKHFKFILHYKLSKNKVKFLSDYLTEYLLLAGLSREKRSKIFMEFPVTTVIALHPSVSIKMQIEQEKFNKINKYLN